MLLTSKCIRGQEDGIAGWVGTLADITAEVGAEAAMVDARDEATQASQQMALETDYQELRRSLKQELTAVADVLDSSPNRR